MCTTRLRSLAFTSINTEYSVCSDILFSSVGRVHRVFQYRTHSYYCYTVYTSGLNLNYMVNSTTYICLQWRLGYKWNNVSIQLWSEGLVLSKGLLRY